MNKKTKKIVVSILRITFTVLTIPVIFIVFVTQPVLGGRKSTRSVDTERLRTTLEKLTVEFHPRDFVSFKNQRKVVDYIADEFRDSGLEVTLQEYSDLGCNFYNVLGFKKGKSDKRIIIGAHYDSYDSTPGADDNASGVAGLLELARLIGNSPVPLDYDIEFVAYNIEEPPFFGTDKMGSYIHAKSLKGNNIEVKVMISLEMIGYFNDAKGSQTYPVPAMKLIAGDQGNFIALVAPIDSIDLTRTIKSAMKGATDLPVYSGNLPLSKIQGLDYSDHRSYIEFGYPAMMITNTSFFRNAEYHTENDTMDRLDLERMAKVIIGVYEAIRAI